MPWLVCRVGTGPGGTAEGLVLHSGWLLNPSQAWAMRMPGTLLAQGSPLAAPNQLETAVSRNKACFAPTWNGYSVILLTSPGLLHCCWLNKVLLPASVWDWPVFLLHGWWVGGCMSKWCACYDVVVVRPQGVLFFYLAPATLSTWPYQQAQSQKWWRYKL